MKTRPILFSTDMVKAILDGRKTQTRRIIKPQPTDIWIEDCRNQSPNLSMYDKNGKQIFWIENSVKNGEVKPKANPSDIMWVRETWKPGAWKDDEHKAAFDYKASPELVNTPWCHFDDMQKFEDLHVKWFEELQEKGIEPSEINEEEERVYYKWEPGRSPLSWKPSIHMPKEVCRLFLKVTNVRVERLKDISEEDAKAEGIETKPYGSPPYFCTIDYTCKPHKSGFRPGFCADTGDQFRKSFFTLWESINGKESLDYNPWVWVYDFEITEKPENFITIE